MNIWILFKNIWPGMTGSGSPAVDRLIKVAQEEHIQIRVVNPDDVNIFITQKNELSENKIQIKGKLIPYPDMIITRLDALSDYRSLAVLQYLEGLGIQSMNSSPAITITRDKLFTQQILANNNLPVVNTMFLQFPVDLELVEEKIGYPIIIKTVYSTRGRGVHLCNSREEFIDMVNFLETSKSQVPMILQEFVATSKGHDLRVFTVGTEILGIMERFAKPGLYKTTSRPDRQTKQFPISEELRKLILSTVTCVGMKYAGIDVLFTKNGFKICEINSSPGFKGLEKTYPGLNIPHEIYQYIHKRLTN